MSDALKETIDEIASLSEADQEKIGRMLLSLIQKLFLCSEFAKDA
jgi:transcription initiation factor TFIIIB Brf1 subunit/transcription initiation factor TFIIB